MRSKIIVTGDNSKTLLIPELNETYHSTKGAITEAKHVFIKEGLHFLNKKKLSIFEMGFGTGLNAIITYNEALEKNLHIYYNTIESNPIDLETIKSIDHLNELDLNSFKEVYYNMHDSKDGESIAVSSEFTFKKYIDEIQNCQLPPESIDLIYYDAFGPKVQPELWDVPALKKMYDILFNGGILVTYCAQGQFKRNLKAVGFKVESIPGPPGKREMTRAMKV